MESPNVDIRALAQLARLEVDEAELKHLETEVPAILGFVEEIQQLGVGAEANAPVLRNVLRNDENPHESGIYTERLLAAAPSQKQNRLVVKQVVSRKKK